jgi:integrase/recombinase XerD
MNSLKEALENYLTMRRNLGFKLHEHGAALSDFVSFLEQKGASHITTNLALEWAQKPIACRPAYWASRLRYVRGFASYRSASDNRTEIPASGLLPYRPQRARPYLYTDNEIQQLLEAALNYSRTTVFKRQTYYCLLGLLAVTGMRISEVLALKLKNVDLKAGVLTVEGSKFGKSRLIPLHVSTQKRLAAFILRRRRFLKGQKSEYFFVSNLGNRLDKGQIARVFYTLSRQVGLRGKTSSFGPRLHDFRHAMATKVLRQWYQNGENVEARLPILSTFLGHVHVSDTYWYLTACPDLMGEVVSRLESWWEVKS